MAGDPSEPRGKDAPSITPGDPAEPRPGDHPERDVTGALHDVSNALTVMLGWVAEARAPFAKREAVAYALGIIEQRARIARDLARRAIGASSTSVDKDDALDATIGDALDALAVEAARSGVRLTRAVHARGARVPSAGDVSRILTNMVMNALAYAPPDSEVVVSVEATERVVVIDVQDAGPGISPPRRDSIFEGDSTRRGGSGVGLRHARALARAAKGDLELLSTEGPGARFRLTWPRGDALPPPPMSVPRLRLLQGQKVLIVEDDADVTQLLEAALGARGAEVTLVRDAAGLEAALAEGPHDAALIDLSPIAADVKGAFDAIRASSPGILLIVMTGRAEALPGEVSTDGIRLVRKPFEVSEVVLALTDRKRK